VVIRSSKKPKIAVLSQNTRRLAKIFPMGLYGLGGLVFLVTKIRNDHEKTNNEETNGEI
jgi:hypothetical protein